MSVLKVEQEVLKESYELGEGLAKLVLAVKKALEDGFQPGQDLPVFVTAALTELPKMVDGLDKMGDEAKDPVLMAKSLSLPLFDMVQGLLAKKEAPQA